MWPLSTASCRYRRHITVPDGMLPLPTVYYRYRRHILVTHSISSLPTAHYRYQRHILEACYGTGSTHFSCWGLSSKRRGEPLTSLLLTLTHSPSHRARSFVHSASNATQCTARTPGWETLAASTETTRGAIAARTPSAGKQNNGRMRARCYGGGTGASTLNPLSRFLAC